MFSDRAFTVILKYELNVHQVQQPLKWADTAGKDVVDPSDFTEKFGDYYIRSIVKGVQFYVMLAFTPSTTSGSNRNTNKVVVEIFRNQVSLKNGCNSLTNFANTIPCKTTIWRDNVPTEILPHQVIHQLNQARQSAAAMVMGIDLQQYKKPKSPRPL
jgi:hypothetical protein